MKFTCLSLLGSILISLQPAAAQKVLVLTCEDAIEIALNESYTIKNYNNSRAVTEYWYIYNKAMFKPKLDLDLSAPSWAESVTTIYQSDGLPVYNSMGNMRIRGDLRFTYVLPTGGNLALTIDPYYETYHTILNSDPSQKLQNKLFYNRVALSFTQPIFTKNALKENLREAELGFQKATKQYTRGQIDIIHNVTSRFYALYESTRLVEITEERLGNAREAFRIARLKAESGQIPESDLLTMEVEIAQDEANLSETKNSLEREKDGFKHLIGIDLYTEIAVHAEMDNARVDIDGEFALKQALAHRTELDEASLDIELQKIEVDRAKRTRRIKGSISGFYDFTGVSTQGHGSVFSLFNSSIHNATVRPPNRGVTLSISIPILDWGRGKAYVRRAMVSLENSEMNRDNITNTITREVRDIVRTVNETQNRLLIHEKNQQLAQRSYTISQMRFENGDISSQELAIEREKLSSVQLNYLKAYIENKLAISDLKRKTMWDFENNKPYIIDWNQN